MKFNLREAAEKAQLQVISEMASGEPLKRVDFAPEVLSGTKTIKEMIGNDDGAAEFVEKITYDLYQGREAVPLLYKQIYQTLSDPNFPKVMEVDEAGPVQVVFLEKFEGGEVVFGQMGPTTQKVVRFKTYAAGIEYDEDIVEYNQTWRVAQIGESFGSAYNKLLNHLHLYPIINGSFTTTAGDLDAQKEAQEGDRDAAVAPVAQLIAFDTDIATTLRNAMQVLPRGTMLLANSSDQFRLEDAIAASMYADTSPSVVKRRLSPSDIVYYDGDEVVVGGKTYSYTGVTAGEAFLIVPRTANFREYIKHDLRVDSDNGDLSRLIISQVVGRARRATWTQLGGKFGVVKVELE